MGEANHQSGSAELHPRHHLYKAPEIDTQPPRSPYHDPDPPIHTDVASTTSSSSASTWDVIDAHLPSTPHTPTSAFPELDAALQSANTALTTVTTASSTVLATLSRSTLSHTTLSLAASATMSASNLAAWAATKTHTDAREFVRNVHEWLLRTDVPLPVPVPAPACQQRQRRATATGASESSNGIIWRSDPLTFGDEQGAFVLDTRYVDDGLSLLGPRRASVGGCEGSRSRSAMMDSSPHVSVPMSVDVAAPEGDDSETEEDSFIGGTGPSAGRSGGSVVQGTELTKDSDGWAPAATGFDGGVASGRNADGV